MKREKVLEGVGKWGRWAGPATMTSRARRDVVAGGYK